MRLTKFSDYALRVLMIATTCGEQKLTIEATAEVFGISQGHLKKVVLALTRAGFLQGFKGRTGGYLLARKPEDINIGAVLRVTETNYQVFDCFQERASLPPCWPLPFALNWRSRDCCLFGNF